MLEELRVKNYALIDDLTVCFEPGFNVLTGETGAGKSILIDALSLVLGGKSKGDGVRQGASEAEVTAILKTTNSPELQEWIRKYSIQPEDDTLLLRRVIKPNGRGAFSIQAVPVTRTALEELAGFQVDIHGQHEHQSLFQISTHRKLLDRFAGLEERVSVYTEQYLKLSALSKRIDELNRGKETLEREIEFLRHAVEEIESAELREGEEEELVERQKILSQHEELARSLERAVDAGAESRNGAAAFLRKTMEQLNGAVKIDQRFSDLLKRCEGVFYEVEDIVDEIRGRQNSVVFDPEELEENEDRLTKIRNLERKYSAATVHGVLDYSRNARIKLDKLKNQDGEIQSLSKERKLLQESVKAEALLISRKRKSAALSFEKKAEKHLHDLGMVDARFTVSLENKLSDDGRQVISPHGVDSIEYLLSANRGERAKPIKMVASGGELSRVMLALKTVLGESDPVPSMIFDEVDSGIGGEVARSVGEHLSKLSRRKQVFCVTHLASIAVFADNHLQVMKTIVDGRTLIRINRVEGKMRVREVARMLAGDNDNSASLEHALRLLNTQGWCITVDETG